MTKHTRLLRRSVQDQIDRIHAQRPPTSQYQIIKSFRGTEFAVKVADIMMRRPIQWPEEFYQGGAARTEVFEAIDQERQYQDDKFGNAKEQSLPGYLVLIQNELDEARIGWAKGTTGRDSVLHEIRQIAALCVAAMEKYGTTGNAISTDDIPVDNID